jgi:hypothetical protein
MRAENLLVIVMFFTEATFKPQQGASTHCKFGLPGESAGELSECFGCLVL